MLLRGIVITIIISAVLVHVAVAQTETTIVDILSNSSDYEGKEVKATGTVFHLVKKTDSEGNPYTSFMFTDENARKALPVIAAGHLDIRNGSKVEVTGVFKKNVKIPHAGSSRGIEATVVKMVK